MALVYLGLGSNLGDRVANIEKAYELIAERAIGTLLRKSPFYETAPIGCDSPLKFVNAVVEIMTDIAPIELLSKLREVEYELGRKRTSDKNSPRTIDIDILLYDFIVINEAELTIPHPELLKRLFVIKPIVDIKPDLLHPVAQKSVQELLESAPPELLNQEVRRL
jgi:2-amino-4-hydroxy-6-hydroxymethyldihydropteridine diphosphokinase